MATKTKPTDEQILDANPQLKQHLQILGFSTLEEYRVWRVDNGFGRKLTVNRNQLHRERMRIREARAVDAMINKRREARHADHLLLEVCRGRHYDNYWRPAVQNFFRAARCTREDGAGAPINIKAIESLITHLVKCKARFLDGTPYYPRFGQRLGNTALEALPLIVAHRRRWVRSIESWSPTSRSPRRQFKSLLQHLFVQYGDLPAFLDQVWFAGFGDRQANLRRLYLHLAGGWNLADCQLMPIPYTKKMAHHFLLAPHNVTVEQAIRWGEVKGMGGDDELARAVMRSRLSVGFANHKFWNVVLQWLIRYPEVNRSYIGSIIDYIQFQRFVPHYTLTGAGQPLATAPREPNFTMRGRTPETLLRQVERWHGTVHDTFVFGMYDWPPCGIAGIDLLEEDSQGELTAWTIRELLSSKQLVQEGEALNHCVASYIDLCQQGESSIWTLERETSHGKVRALTIEVRPQQREICQFSGNWNRQATEEETRVIRQWAARAKLRIAE